MFREQLRGADVVCVLVVCQGADFNLGVLLWAVPGRSAVCSSLLVTPCLCYCWLLLDPRMEVSQPPWKALPLFNSDLFSALAVPSKHVFSPSLRPAGVPGSLSSPL